VAVGATVLIGVVATVAGCGAPTESSPHVIAQGDLPSGLQVDGSVTPREPQTQERIAIWFVREDGLARAVHAVPGPATPQAVVDELLLGPDDREQGLALRSAIPDPEAVPAVSVERGVATVQLTSAFSEIPAADQVLAVGQLVMTLTGLPGIGRVRFVVDESQVAIPLPNGEVAEDAVSREDYAELAAP
jgi:spore germination protein GerM